MSALADILVNKTLLLPDAFGRDFQSHRQSDDYLARLLVTTIRRNGIAMPGHAAFPFLRKSSAKIRVLAIGPPIGRLRLNGRWKRELGPMDRAGIEPATYGFSDAKQRVRRARCQPHVMSACPCNLRPCPKNGTTPPHRLLRARMEAKLL